MLTPSDATRDELLGLGFRSDKVTAVPNGVEPFFQPGGERSFEGAQGRGRGRVSRPA